MAFHYDSLDGLNGDAAQMVHRKLEQLLGFRLALQELHDTPQQDNGMDCGVHVCWAMKHLLVNRLLQVGSKGIVEMSLGGHRCDAAKFRRSMLKICEGLRKKASRR